MLDAKKLLDQFLGSGAGSASGKPGGGLSEAIGGALSRMGGPGSTPAPVDQQGRPPAPQQSSGGGDLRSQIEGFAKGPLGGVAGGAIAGTLASVLLGGGKKKIPMSGSAVKLGGLAILGGLAYKAWQNYQDKNQQPPAQAPSAPPPAAPVQIAPPPQETAFVPNGSDEEQKLGLLLVRAMIAAARSDGRIDGDEIAKIRDALKAAGADGDEQTFLIDHLGRPDDLDEIAAEARGPELASEVWLAARLTIDPDTDGEKRFLETLAQKLGLGAPLVAHLEQMAAQAKASGVEAG
ncbi:tellurite resistance TerB family protein [Chenggangzhangella methanolivorans]|uniref:Tellurite resistance TerB family protein n=1 Tax=Chenggangzhangella methanolivorans TaxID=1437009 RepID=A0A9E6RI34_9HYPH|nr:tellurite resistance TerB family protein [Chenggangzhangella methanolivorans]QZO01851.1 tellurite resistance TerB family protein [Chenggangzhangella methanolivorans]